MTRLMVCPLIVWHSAQSWVEVPAQILSIELKEDRDGKGRTSYTVTAQYAYEYYGQKYTSHGISPYDDQTGADSFQQDTYRELSEYQKSDKPFHCYVNSARPEQALLYRDLRWLMLIYGVFGVLFFGCAYLGIMNFVLAETVVWTSPQNTTLAQAHPKMPWMWKPNWAAGQIISSSKRKMVFVVIAATFWNLVSAPLWLVLPDEILRKGNYVACFGLLFPVIGLGFIVWAIAVVLRWHKFGSSVFRMSSVPGVIGGQLAGVIQTSVKIWPADGFHLTLSCIRRIRTGSTTNKVTQEKKLWEETQTIVHELLEDRAKISAIPVVFQIPSDCRPTHEINNDDQTLWQLKVTAKEPGFGYSATFDVPVFKTPESDDLSTADTTRSTARE